MENHNYYVVIPAHILLNQELTDKQKLLIGLITNLSNIKGYCFASNKYLSECLGCSESAVRHNISELEDKKFLGRIIKVNQKKEVEFRTLTVLDPRPQTDTPMSANRHTPPSPFGHIITNTLNNKEYISFVDFWDLYGKKKGDRRKAEKAWNKLDAATRRKIIDFIPAFKKSVRDIQFLPFPTTFLNQERWNDEIEPPKLNGVVASIKPLENNGWR